MGSRFIAAAALTALAALQPASASSPSIVGHWRTDGSKAVVEIAPCGDRLCGTIVRVLASEPAGGVRDTENPNADLRGRKLLGLRVFWDLKQDGDVWQGRGYNPEDGRYFQAYLDRREGNLDIKGCILLFCKSKTWMPD